ncbi:MAG: amino acid adenylation domain-containing protein [Ignavibacteriaceae bacterium]
MKQKFIHKIFEEQVEQTPELTAVVFEDRNLTYAELNNRANQLAIRLIAEGVSSDALVGICLDRSLDLIIGMLGVLKAGGVCLPLDLNYPQERLSFMLADSGVDLILTQKKTADKVPDTNAKKIFLDEFVYSNDIVENLTTTLSDNNLIYVIYTSGSTGLPKGVKMPHSAIYNLIKWQNTKSTPGMWKTLQFAPISFDVSFQEIFSTLTSGSTLVLLNEEIRRDPINLLEFIIENEIERIFLPYIALQNLAEAVSVKVAHGLKLKHIITAGEQLKVTPQIIALFQKLNDAVLHNQYGPSETHVITAFELNGNPASWSKLPSIGKPIDNSNVVFLDENLKEVPSGQIGEMYLGGKCLALGYHKRNDLTESRFIKLSIDGYDEQVFYKSGDLGVLSSDGNIEFLGRNDDQIKIRGYRIEPGEIESVISKIHGITNNVIALKEISEGRKILVSYFITQDKEIDIDSVKKYLNNHLPDYMIPNYFMRVNSFPLTPSGKIDKKSLPQPYNISKAESVDNKNLLGDEVEEKLILVWKELLGIDDIGLNDNFFDLGGDSLLMGRLQIKISSVLKEQINIVELYQYPTISSLAEYIDRKRNQSKDFKISKSAIVNSSNNDVAIIGIAGRYPKAKTIKEFWENLVNGVEAISFFSDEELENLPNTNSDSELKFVKARGVLEDVDKFDAEFFGFNPREASIMDPQHRIFLECAWEALEDAGYVPEKFDGAIGIFAGSSLNTYLIYNVLSDRQKQVEMANSYQLTDYTTLTGNDNGFLTTKVAYKLGLKGPAINVQTACSTSLVATAQAYQSLISGQCDMALAGGVSVSFPQKRGYYFVDGSIGSVDGHCRAFDAEATGTVFSSGAGIIVMKRLDVAIKDGDAIYAVIKSVAVNNDGSNKAGYMAPSVDGQAEVISKAHQLAGINAESVKYIEAHGTGTPVGDPIEVTALEKAFRLSTSKKQFCGIGTVKSNIGHSDAAAGITGVIKTALTLKNGVIPPTLHYTKPNTRFDFANSPFYVVDKLTRLDNFESPVRAGVSSFGVGGTNAHAILEQYLDKNNISVSEVEKQLIIVSAKTEKSLKNNIEVTIDYLNHNTNDDLGNIAFTLQEGRHEFEWRQFVVADSIKKSLESLKSVLSSGLNKNKARFNEKHHLVFMFAGQGAQYLNMGRGLYEEQKLFKEIVDESSELLIPHLGLDIRDLLFPKVVDEFTAKKLEQTVYTQPALFIIEYALARLLINYGIKPASMIGHSVGEYVAACLAGVFSFNDVLFILSRRAKLMQEQASGSMLSVRANESEIKDYLNDDIALAAVNSPNLLVLSGKMESIKVLSERLSELKIENKLLFTSHAYHSKMMEPAIEPFIQAFSSIRLDKPAIPFISSLTGTWITDEQAVDPSYWAAQLRNTVRFSDGIKELQKKNNLVLIELGPGRALSTMASQHKNESGKQSVISTLTQPNEDADDVTNLLNAIGKLWISGISVEWKNFHLLKNRKRVHLPTYQFDRKSYWIEPPKNLVQNIQNVERQVTKKQKVKKVVQENTMTRKEYIVTILQDSLEELSGIKKSDLDENKTFLELGFDSLFMTQVSLAFQKKFGVKITLRQLLETAPTINAIAGFIDSTLPSGKFDAPKQEVIIEEEIEVENSGLNNPLTLSDNIDEPGRNFGNSTLEKLVFEQLELMKKQLQLLGSAKNATIPDNKILQALKKGSDTSQTAVKKNIDSTKKDEKKVFERFGPYKPIETKKGGVLSERQQNYLDKFILEYNRKTPTSKKMTQEHRAHYSDPRTVSGFLPIWKEMTYQIITKESYGSKLLDVDDNEYIDVIMGFGQYLFGHNPKFIRDVIQEQIKKGFEIGPQSPIAGEVAKLICEFTGLDRAAFCVTGSEAVLGAMRAARTVTGKDKIVFFAGDYHGIIDEVLIKSKVDGDDIRTMPIAPGIPRENVQNTIALEYGSEESLKTIEKLLPELAAVMIEPIQSRRLDFQPKEFILKLRKMTEEANIPLIFDEVITGFRTAAGGAQEFYGIKADIATYGKVIGGGFPIGVIAGNKLYMDAFDGGYWQYGDDSIPEAGVTFFAGTFARHPLSLAGAFASLSYLKSDGGKLQKTLNKKAAALADELNIFMLERNVPIKILNFSSVLYYSYPKDLNYFSLLFYVLRHKGIHILEGFPFFLSEAHSDDDTKFIINVFKESIIELQDNGFFPAPLNQETVDKKNYLTQSGSEKKSPLADAQKEIWLAVQLGDTASCAFNESGNIELKGKLNFDVLNQALKKLIERHEALRTTFSVDGNFQIVKNNLEFNLGQIDLSHLTDREKISKLNNIITDEPKKIFDMVKGPLFRIYLIKLGEENYNLIITAHHIICDGWSFDVMVQDLSRIYTELMEGKNSTSIPAMQMREYVDYLETFKSTDDYKNQEKFWLNLLHQPLPEIELPLDKDRPSVRTFYGARVTGKIDSDLLIKIKSLGLKNKSTLFTTMLSFFGILLHKLSGQDDIITGIPAAGQQVVGADDLVGHCTNLLPIRMSVDSEKKFSEFIKELKSLVLDCYENQQVTYGDIISKLKIKRSADRSPLLSTMFNIDPAIVGLNFYGLKSKINVNPRAGYQFELGFNVVVYDDHCEVECDFNTDLFTKEKIEVFINYYRNIIEQIVSNENILIKDIQILNNKDIANIIDLLNGRN